MKESFTHFKEMQNLYFFFFSFGERCAYAGDEVIKASVARQRHF